MKTKVQNKERGQALILILLAVVGLVGLTALAVDGGHVFATQRQARNAADTASFAAAIALIDEDALTDYQTLALARAAGNNFADDSGSALENPDQVIDVIVNYPPLADSSGTPSAYVGNTEYVQVIIAAQVPTFFAPVLGVSSLPIRVQAVAKAMPPYSAPIGGDNGIVALGDVCNSVRTHGGGETHLTGGGVFSNSTANGTPGNCWAFNAGGTTGQIFTDGVTMVGCLDPDDVSGGLINMNAPYVYDPDSDCGAEPIPYPPPVPDLDVDCAALPVGTVSGTTATPGRWSTALGNLGGSQVFPPAGVDSVETGVYCITGRFNLGSTDTLSSHGDGVTFILDGDLRWNAGATVDLLPSTSGKIAGLLIYRPLNNPVTGLCDGGGNPDCQTLQINGGADTQFSGTIYAPDSNCDITGTSSSFSPNTQAICYVVDIGGDSDWTITYDGSDNWDFPYPPETELNR